ncbi:hypothetical protein [Roseovarius sp. D0-M9]|uniref:hypothetical protein n=1 Tax=Roseovarius sp. D0-M9 TaxID=3127117 RepID=UPI00300FA99E
MNQPPIHQMRPPKNPRDRKANISRIVGYTNTARKGTVPLTLPPPPWEKPQGTSDN